MNLVGELWRGSLDIIGDIHGEYGALLCLLDRLGYDYFGNHPEGRRLVFLGDLVDRGPDSVAVLELVQRLVETNKAQCILGNHELNILLNQKKHGNGWFYGETESLARDHTAVSYNTLVVSDQQRNSFIEFLLTLPVALERDDLRVVHAAWDSASIARLRQSKGLNVLEAFRSFEMEIESRITEDMSEDQKELCLQNENPVKLVTSGLECLASERFWSSGKWRQLSRVN